MKHMHVMLTPELVAIDMAQFLVQHMRNVISKQQHYTLVLAGGSTPKRVYELLAQPQRASLIDWDKVHIFFGDERFVPFDDERNNARMAYDALLSKVPIPEVNIHKMLTEGVTPEQSAEAYDAVLQRYFKTKVGTFDMVLLGMGDDAHTLSLFPFTPVLKEQRHWVRSLWLEAQNMYRITLTAPVVNMANNIAFMVTGANKRDALYMVLDGERNEERYPSQLIQPVKGELHWFVDQEAGFRL